jgi:hypothetical protein
MPTRSLPPQAEPFLSVETVNAVLAHLEPLSAKQDVDPPVAIANAGIRELPDPLSQDSWILRHRPVAEARS